MRSTGKLYTGHININDEKRVALGRRVMEIKVQRRGREEDLIEESCTV